MSPWLAPAFLTGLISSLHCVGMCGPLVAALPLGRLTPSQRWQGVGLYHTGRIATYGILGALAGAMNFGLYLLGWQRPLAIGFGVLLLLRLVWKKGLPTRLRWRWLTNQLTQTLRTIRRQSSWTSFAGLGLLNGLLPCGFTYLALAGTLATHTPLDGAAYMLLFGLGTLPALLGVNLVAGWLKGIGGRHLNRFLSFATLVVALLLIGRGLANYHIPSNPADLIPLCHELLTK